MRTERQNWVVRAYDEEDNIIDEFVIKNRLEHEAEHEAMGSIKVSYADWTMTPETEFPILS